MSIFERLPDPKMVKVLARSLVDKSVGVRVAAANALGASRSSDAVAPLLAKLDDSASKVRLAVVAALGKIADKRAVTPLIARMADEAFEVRQLVVRTLGELGDSKASSSLISALSDPSKDVRMEALFALGVVRAVDAVSSITPIALGTNTGSTPESRRAALSTLGRIGGPAAVAAIVKSFGTSEDLQPNNEQSRCALTPSRAAALALGPQVVDSLQKVLAESSNTLAAPSAACVLAALHVKGSGEWITSAIRRKQLDATTGLTALERLGDASQLPVCLEYLSDSASVPEQKAALSATTALIDPDNPDGRAVEPLLSLLDSWERRGLTTQLESVLVLLGRTGASRVSARLRDYTNARERSQRLAAIEALGNVPTSPENDNALLSALGDPVAPIRMMAALSLARQGSGGALPQLAKKLSENGVDRIALMIAYTGILRRTGDDKSMESARALLPALGPERDVLIESLGSLPRGASIPLLMPLLSEDVASRRSLALSLAQSQQAGLDLLRKLAGDVSGDVRAQAAFSLGFSGDAKDEPLLATLAKDPLIPVAANAVASLGRLGARVGTQNQALCDALDDSHAYVRANALASLAWIANSKKGTICGSPSQELTLLLSDLSDEVRTSAVRLAEARLANLQGDAGTPYRLALEKCVAGDVSGVIARRCQSALQPASVSAATRPTVKSLLVFVAGKSDVPAAQTPYILERTDGFYHFGVTNRAGAFLEFELPAGQVQLVNP